MDKTFPPTTEWFTEIAPGRVERTISTTQTGRIRYQGSFWKAELAAAGCRAIAPGEVVEVVGRRGIRLLVVPNEVALSKMGERSVA
ncbi:MAG: NfeD family protein [Oculatellaceae cyanobacterium Prado106]|nr:NfeD family protein [Oculatellaceae cyanobacterium Prado106]